MTMGKTGGTNKRSSFLKNTQHNFVKHLCICQLYTIHLQVIACHYQDYGDLSSCMHFQPCRPTKHF